MSVIRNGVSSLVEHGDTIRFALSGHTDITPRQADEARAAFDEVMNQYAEYEKNRAEGSALIDLAEERCLDGVAIDGDAAISLGDDGAYVEGWVYVAYPDGYFEDEDEEGV